MCNLLKKISVAAILFSLFTFSAIEAKGYGGGAKSSDYPVNSNEKIGAVKEEKVKEKKSKAKSKYGAMSKKKLSKMTKEHNKHVRRIAKIDRLEALSKTNGDQALLNNIEKMRQNEIQRHERFMQHFKAEQ